MSIRPKSSWPLYFVIDAPGQYRLPFDREELVLVNASFAFPNSFLQQVYRELSRVLVIMRVVYHSRCLPVTRQSSEFMARLDKAWCKPPCVPTAPYCQLCLKHRMLMGVSVTSKNDL